MLTIVLSGPKAAESQARTALAAAGFVVNPDSDDHGLPADPVDPDHRPKRYKAPRQAIAFLTCEAEDGRICPRGRRVARVRAAYAASDPPPEPSFEERLFTELADVKSRLGLLEGQMAVESPPSVLQDSTYGAEQADPAIFFDPGARFEYRLGPRWPGRATDCQITAGSGLNIECAPGELWVPGSSSSTQSGYYCRVSSSSTLSIAAANESNPRIDRISGIVKDAAYAGSKTPLASRWRRGPDFRRHPHEPQRRPQRHPRSQA